MDAYPEDTAGNVGGDGLIRFLDWQVVLQRSLGLDSSRWIRTWSDGGVRVASAATGINTGGLRSTPVTTATNPPPGLVWYRQASIKAMPVENAQPGVPVDMPIYVNVASGEHLAGLAFRATLQAEGNYAARENFGRWPQASAWASSQATTPLWSRPSS